MEKINRFVKIGTLAMLITALSACSMFSKKAPPAPVETKVVVQQSYVISDPGAVEYVWEPPVINVVDVPPGLDPEGIYYRPSHQEVIEVRQGRWQYYKPKTDVELGNGK